MWIKTSVITAHSIITNVNRSAYVTYMALAPFINEVANHTPYRLPVKDIKFSGSPGPEGPEESYYLNELKASINSWDTSPAAKAWYVSDVSSITIHRFD